MFEGSNLRRPFIVAPKTRRECVWRLKAMQFAGQVCQSYEGCEMVRDRLEDVVEVQSLRVRPLPAVENRWTWYLSKAVRVSAKSERRDALSKLYDYEREIANLTRVGERRQLVNDNRYFRLYLSYLSRRQYVLSCSHELSTFRRTLKHWTPSVVFIMAEGRKWKRTDESLLWRINNYLFTHIMEGIGFAIKHIHLYFDELLLPIGKWAPRITETLKAQKQLYTPHPLVDPYPKATQELAFSFWFFKKRFRSLPRRIRRKVYKAKMGRIWPNRVR